MSIDALRAIRRSVLILSGWVALSPLTYGADVDFRPTLTFGLFHSGNVLLIGFDPTTGQQTTPVGDDLAAVAVNLDVDRNTADSSFSFHYQPTYVAYRDRTDLDYFGNVLAMDYSKQRARGSTFNVNFDGARTDYQGVTQLTADRPNTIVPRTTISRAHLAVNGAEAVAKRSLLDWQVRGEYEHFDPVPGVVFNDNSAAAIRGGWRFAYSERGTIGLAVEVARFAYENSPSVLDESLYLTGTYNVGRTAILNYDLGVTRATSDTLSSINGIGNVTFTRQLTDVTFLDAGASQTYNAGSGLQGTSRDTGTWVSYRREPQRRGFNAAVNASYWYRSLLDLGGGSTGQTLTFVFDGTLGWTFNRFLALNAVASYVNQSTRNGAPGALDADYGAYGLVLRWAMLGKQSSAAVGVNALPYPRGRP